MKEIRLNMDQETKNEKIAHDNLKPPFKLFVFCSSRLKKYIYRIL